MTGVCVRAFRPYWPEGLPCPHRPGLPAGAARAAAPGRRLGLPELQRDEGVITLDEALQRVSGEQLAHLMFPSFDNSDSRWGDIARTISIERSKRGNTRHR